MDGRTKLYNLMLGNTSSNMYSLPYDTIGRTTGATAAQNSDDNFFEKRRKSIDNAIGTTGAAFAATGGDILAAARSGLSGDGHYYSAIDKRHNQKLEDLLSGANTERQDIYKAAGFDNVDDYYNAKEQAEKDLYNKYGLDIDSYMEQRADLSRNDPFGKSDEVKAFDADLELKKKAAKDNMSAEDLAVLSRFDETQNKINDLNNKNTEAVSKEREDYKDFATNNPISQRINQDQGKFLGSAINTLSTAFDIMAPGAGIAANALQGGIEGVADELEQNGLKDFDINRAGQNALIGLTTGAVTGGLNKGVNNVLAKNGGNLFKGGNAVTRTLNNLGSQTAAGRVGSTLATGAARGALSGAVGGATGAGMSAAMNGQDVIGSAIEGAKRGATQGALAGGVMAGAGLAKNSIQNAIKGGQNPEIEVYNRLMQQQEAEDQNALMNKQGAQLAEEDSDLYPAFEPGEDRIQQRNKLQSIGEQLETAAKTQKNSALYDSLDAKTAQRATKTGAVEQLAELGVRPENYLEAAKTSDYVNDVVSRLAENSEVKVMVPDMTDRLSLDNMDILIPEQAAKKYNTYIRQIVADGSTPDQYSAGYLLQKSRELGNAAVKIKNSRVDGADALSSALTEAKYNLRDIANQALANENITSDIANEQISKGLAKLGASKELQNYYTEPVDGKAPTAGDYIRRSSLLEQARDMGTQMDAEKYTRSASKAPTNPVTKMWNASGLDKPVDVVLKNTVAPVASGITKLAGKALKGAGNIEANIKNAFTGNDTPIPTNNTPVDTTNVIDTTYNPATRVYEAIGRTEGLNNAEQARTANYITEAVQDANQNQFATEPAGNTLESLAMPVNSGSSNNVYSAMYGQSSSPATGSAESYFQPTGDYWTDILGIAMTNSIKDGDYNTFGALYSMYQDAASKIQKQSSSSTGNQKITATQQRANAAMNSLNRLSGMTPDLGYNLSGIPVIGNIATLGGNDYEGEAKSLAQQIGYMVSGANIKEEEAYNIGKAYVPQPFDSEQTRRLKLQRAYDIIRQYQNGYATDDMTNLEA